MRRKAAHLLKVFEIFLTISVRCEHLNCPMYRRGYNIFTGLDATW